MSLSTKYNNCLEGCTILQKSFGKIGTFLDAHPTVYKIVLLVNHLFRAAMMVGFMYLIKVPMYISIPISFAGSLFYRATVERHCAHKFALASFLGAAAFMLAFPAIMRMASEKGFVSTATTCQAVLSLLALTLYCLHILFTVDHEVNKRMWTLKNQAPVIASCCRV